MERRREISAAAVPSSDRMSPESVTVSAVGDMVFDRFRGSLTSAASLQRLSLVF